MTIDTVEFENFAVEDKLHIAISVKDFKAIVTHGETINASISSSYSHPNRPLQLAYDGEGILAEFTLMTIGDYRGASATPAPIARDTAQTSPNRPRTTTSRPDESEPPPPSETPTSRTPAPHSFRQEATGQRSQRPSPPPPVPTLDDDSLFLPRADDDSRWDPSISADEDEDMLGWNSMVERV